MNAAGNSRQNKLLDKERFAASRMSPDATALLATTSQHHLALLPGVSVLGGRKAVADMSC
jgi:hypothetical protein